MPALIQRRFFISRMRRARSASNWRVSSPINASATTNSAAAGPAAAIGLLSGAL
jgi:hypothetical protein